MRLPKLRIPKHELRSGGWCRRVVGSMTVSYQYEVASSTSGGFTRLLFMWRGSLYKLIYRELLLFCVAFALLSAAYRNLFTDQQKRLFEKVVVYCDTFIAFIPLSFVLGFYVAYVAGRWWQQYMAIPWPDKVMHTLALYVGGNDIHDRMIRRTLMRYLNLSLTLVLRSISSAVKRRFPTMDHLVEAGFMTGAELQMFQAVPNLEFNTYWIPCTWFIALLKDTKKSNRITDSQGLQLIVEEFNEFRSKCGLLWSYDWISIPLVYTQVVTLATYSFFLAALVGRQYVDNTTSLQKRQFQMEVDIYVPLFTILQFFFYMGLLKVAEQLINPFGDDDEDFELNWLIDRHIKVSYLGVDTLMARYPPLMKDKYFDEINLILPYTGAAFAYKKKTYRGSVHNMMVPEDQQSMFLPEISEEPDDEYESYKRGSHSSKTSSFNNLMHAVSPPAGIWRSNADKNIQVLNRDMEEGLQQDVVKDSSKLERFTTKAPWKKPNPNIAVKIPLSKPSFTSLNLSEWSSHSTLDSVDSILPNPDSPEIKSSNPFELSFEEETNKSKNETQNSEDIKSPKISASRNSIPLSSVPPTDPKIQRFSSTGNIALSLKNSFNKHFKDKKCDDRSAMKRMFGRRQSSSSGQWKGVRWKPVIDDSAGDSWSDNTHRRPSLEVCNRCRDPLAATEPPSHCSSVTASFQSLNSEQSSELPLPLPLPPKLNISHKDRKRPRSNSWFVSSDVRSVDNDSGAKESLAAFSLPNICLVTSNPNGRGNQKSVSNTSSEENPYSLNVMQKSYSTSPRAFSKLQETITEENESRQ